MCCVPSGACAIVDRTVKDREISKGIVRNPHRMGGVPCVQGTRIPAEMVANLLAGDQPMTAEAVVESYPTLTFHDIANVKAWAKRREFWERPENRLPLEL